MGPYECRIMKRYHFRGQDPGEKIIKLLHRHLLIIITGVMMLLIAFLLPVVCYFLLQEFLPFTLEGFYFYLFIFFSGIYILFVWLRLNLSIGDYYLDAWIITDKRIVDIVQSGLFKREVSECRLDRIQDVTTRVKGLTPTIFDFGDVHIQTAGREKEFIFRQVPDPYGVKDLILDLCKKHETSFNI